MWFQGETAGSGGGHSSVPIPVTRNHTAPRPDRSAPAQLNMAGSTYASRARMPARIALDRKTSRRSYARGAGKQAPTLR